MFILIVLIIWALCVFSVLCARIRRDRREIRNLLSSDIVPRSQVASQIPIATVVMVVAMPVDRIDDDIDIVSGLV